MKFPEQYLNGVFVIKEIEELHQFFEDWFNGTGQVSITRFVTAIDDHFVLITPEANMIHRDDIVDLIISGENSSKGRRIWVGNIETKVVGDTILATYNEYQSHKGDETKRLSTALFVFDDKAPNSVRWVHVHETWVNSN